MGSLYSMKPNPFISFTSVISPVPWAAKWDSTSDLVAVKNPIIRQWEGDQVKARHDTHATCGRR